MDQLIIRYWLNQANHNIKMLSNELSGLSEDKLNYRVHLHKCSIREIMNNLMRLNDTAIGSIKKPCASVKRSPVKYARGWSGLILLQSSRLLSCKQSVIINKDVIRVLEKQQEQLKTMIREHQFYDLNKKTIRVNFILKVSVGNMFEYILAFQKTHFLMARRILMLQDL